MKNDEILDQTADILCRAETLVESAHRLLRNDEINQSQFIEIKKLELDAQRLYRKFKDESHDSE